MTSTADLQCGVSGRVLTSATSYRQYEHVKKTYLQDLIQLNVGCVHVLLGVVAPLYYPLRIPRQRPAADGPAHHLGFYHFIFTMFFWVLKR